MVRVVALVWFAITSAAFLAVAYKDSEHGRTELPSYVCLLYRGDPNEDSCFGTLVAAHWVLTSTSCLSSAAGNLVNNDPVIVCPMTPQDATPVERVFRTVDVRRYPVPTGGSRVGSTLALLKLDREASGPFPVLHLDSDKGTEAEIVEKERYLKTLSGAVFQSKDDVGWIQVKYNPTMEGSQMDALSGNDGAPLFVQRPYYSENLFGRKQPETKEELCAVMTRCRILTHGLKTCTFVRVTKAWRWYRCIVSDTCHDTTGPFPSPSPPPILSPSVPSKEVASPSLTPLSVPTIQIPEVSESRVEIEKSVPPEVATPEVSPSVASVVLESSMASPKADESITSPEPSPEIELAESESPSVAPETAFYPEAVESEAASFMVPAPSPQTEATEADRSFMTPEMAPSTETVQTEIPALSLTLTEEAPTTSETLAPPPASPPVPVIEQKTERPVIPVTPAPQFEEHPGLSPGSTESEKSKRVVTKPAKSRPTKIKIVHIKPPKEKFPPCPKDLTPFLARTTAVTMRRVKKQAMRDKYRTLRTNFCTDFSPNTTDSQGDSSLHYTARFNAFNSAWVLCKLNASTEVLNKEGRTPFYEAVVYHSIETMEMLLDFGADINTKESHGLTPLLNATMTNDLTMVEVLLEFEADVNIPDNRKQTPLHIAAHNGFTSILEVLLDAGAEIECRDKDYNTPLHLTAAMGDVKSSKMLVEAGASTDALNLKNLTPRDVICQENEKCDSVTIATLQGLLESNATRSFRVFLFF